MASDTPYNVAVVGLGIVGTRTIELMRRHPRFSVECAFDLSEEARSIAAQTFAGVDILPTLGEVFRRDGINLVYIATPPAAHADIARMAIGRNWGVFCEKPLGVDNDDSENLTAEINATNVAQAINFVFSGAPSAHEAKYQLDAGLIGDILGAELILKFSAWPRGWQAGAAWLNEQSQGGMIREVGSHFAYLTKLLIGQPEVTQRPIIEYPASGQAETSVMGVWNAGECRVSVNARVGGVRRDIVRYRLLGTKASMVLEDWYNLILEKPDGEIQLLDPKEAQRQVAYERQLDLLAAQLDDGEKRLADFNDALDVQRLIERTLNY
mgnify:FL=1